MKTLSFNARKIEALVYAVLGLFVFAVPFVTSREFHVINWYRLWHEWFHVSLYFLVFLINVYVLVPGLLLKKKYINYLLWILVIIVAVTVMDSLVLNLYPPHDPAPGRPFMGGRPGPKPFPMILVDHIIFIILISGAGAASKLVNQWLNEEKLRKDIEKEQLRTNLALLRQQVSPHFFMNTLNNIHALVDINTEDAKDAIIRLSTLMRYLLYDTAKGEVSLKKEIDFINSFIALAKLRFSEKVTIEVKFPENIPDISIPPMLFISLLENAFKHGVSYQSDSFIYFELTCNETSLHCNIRNSKHKIAAPEFGEYSGIGLENIKKSLKLLYDTDYSLIISDLEHEFVVNLTIPL
ncbi:MAG: histidine kinase [Bacteroidota bacterium]